MTAAYEVYKHWQGERVLVAQAKTVLVSYNHKEGRPAPWAEEVVEAAKGFDSGGLIFDLRFPTTAR